jgi:hypothetical protein
MKSKKSEKIHLRAHYEKDNEKTYWTTFWDVSNIYSLCLGLAYPSYIPELPSTLFCLCSKKHAGGRDGLMTY